MEIKKAAAGLPAVERTELIAWLAESDEVAQLRLEQLQRDLQIGLDEIARGDIAVLDIEAVKRAARGA